MSSEGTVELPDEQATIALAEALKRELPSDVAGWTVLLAGDLGSGKSTLARALIHSLGHTGAVPSPTYTLVEPYALEGGTVYHVDLYRVADPGELHFLGFDELDGGLRLVEWPDRAPDLERAADLRIKLDYLGAGRQAQVLGLSERGRELARRLVEALIQPQH